jgi:hypothetical protein
MINFHVRYAHENGCDWDEYTCRHAVSGGHLDCLKYLTLKCQTPSTYPPFVIRYAHENGCEWQSKRLLVTNAHSSLQSAGHLACLKYLVRLLTWLIAPFQLKSDIYAHENGCPWNENTIRNAAVNGHYECVKYPAILTAVLIFSFNFLLSLYLTTKILPWEWSSVAWW